MNFYFSSFAFALISILSYIKASQNFHIKAFQTFCVVNSNKSKEQFFNSSNRFSTCLFQINHCRGNNDFAGCIDALSLNLDNFLVVHLKKADNLTIRDNDKFRNFLVSLFNVKYCNYLNDIDRTEYFSGSTFYTEGDSILRAFLAIFGPSIFVFSIVTVFQKWKKSNEAKTAPAQALSNNPNNRNNPNNQFNPYHQYPGGLAAAIPVRK